ncbi:MAPEG family protein [Pseudovibrio axinellae]|uniref:MAPEG family protein n=1 Tax=Pseudovibrio axinellae TaxID=989403 RepID=A0A161VC42_9HYPH|nr:MAPEG family protein [Pseudovibrio axinellae]KZL21725.1 MAPEG family protein [Pseudovibrio axinellae]SEQ21041.1 MAPEG family protein [Pseudovibrio axinellae]
MDFVEKQRGVLQRMVVGALVTATVLLLGALLNPFGFAEDWNAVARFWVAAVSMLSPSLFLMIGIGRLAMHRFTHADDIDGGGLTRGSSEAKMLQSILQNTLEQAVLAGFVYVAWVAIMPGSTMSVPPLAALFFALGRILFFTSYEKGAPWRGTGFVLTFYPTIFMLLAIMVSLMAGL